MKPIAKVGDTIIDLIWNGEYIIKQREYISNFWGSRYRYSCISIDRKYYKLFDQVLDHRLPHSFKKI